MSDADLLRWRLAAAAEIQLALADVAALRANLDEAGIRQNAIIDERDEAQAQLAAALKERDEARAECDKLRLVLNVALEKGEELTARHNTLVGVANRLRAALAPTDENHDAIVTALYDDPEEHSITPRGTPLYRMRMEEAAALLAAIRARAGLEPPRT